MCEWILTSMIIGFVNVGPGVYVVQGFNKDHNVQECVIEAFPKENDINLLTLFT